jgi:hypothetical protein
MDLLRKVRVLIGALARRPFTPHPEQVDLDQAREDPRSDTGPHQGATAHQDSQRDVQQPQVTDTERVADLLAQQRKDANS